VWLVKMLLHGSDGFEGPARPQPGHPPGEPVDTMVWSTFVNVMGPQLLRRCVAGEPMEGTDPDRVGDGHEGPCLPPARGEARRHGRPRGPLGAGRRMGPRGQACTQGAVPCAGLPGALVAGAFVRAGGDPTPSRQARGGLNAPHVEAPCCPQACCTPLVAPGNRVQPADRLGKGQPRRCGGPRPVPTSS
jgi:hypothetical protein